MTAGSAPAQWSRTDRLSTGGLLAIGVVLWSIGWYEVSGRPTMDEQRAPLNLAVIGVALIGVAHLRWFLRGRRAVGLRRRVLIQAITPRVVKAIEVPVDELVVGGERFYHRRGCALTVDREWALTSRNAQERDGRVPCGVCGP